MKTENFNPYLLPTRIDFLLYDLRYYEAKECVKVKCAFS